MTRELSEALLCNKNSFLLRDSSKKDHFVLTICEKEDISYKHILLTRQDFYNYNQVLQDYSLLPSDFLYIYSLSAPGRVATVLESKSFSQIIICISHPYSCPDMIYRTDVDAEEPEIVRVSPWFSDGDLSTKHLRITFLPKQQKVSHSDFVGVMQALKKYKYAKVLVFELWSNFKLSKKSRQALVDCMLGNKSITDVVFYGIRGDSPTPKLKSTFSKKPVNIGSLLQFNRID